MPIDCQRKRRHDTPFCPADCAARPGGPVFDRVKIARPEDVPPADPRAIDVAILDMNHGWPNVGHDAVIAAIQDVACDLSETLAACGLKIRALSYDVRGSGMVPEAGLRFALYVGTGGPGHIDPRRNDGVDPGAQGIVDDPSWEPRLYALFDAIVQREDAALLAVCHTFGILCRWLSVATPVTRGPEKGGKSEGVKENLLTDAGLAHPLLAAMARRLDGGRLRVLDSRIYDLVPTEGASERVAIVGTETLGADGPAGIAMTMMEIARDPSGRMPRIFAVNHHPEIVDRARLLTMMRAKLDGGEIDRAWYDARLKNLESRFDDAGSDAALRLTSEFTFIGPLRFHLVRALRVRAESLGLPFLPHENEIQRALLAGT